MKLCRTKLMVKGSHFTNPFKLRNIENRIMPVQYTPCCKIVHRLSPCYPTIP